jgi:ankyrin repeat protein
MLTEQLWAAVEKNDQTLCRMLVDQGADPNKKDTTGNHSGRSPLLSALARTHLHAVEGMLKSPQFKFTRDNPGALRECVVKAISIQYSMDHVITLLLSAPRDRQVSLADGKSKTPLSCLIERALYITTSRELASLLVQHGDDPNVITPGTDKTPLEYAIYKEHPIVVCGIFQSPSFVYKIPVTDKALTMAIKKDYHDISECLLKFRQKELDRLKGVPGSDLTTVFLDDQLWAAVEKQNRLVCKILVNQGADPNKKETMGQSPLSFSLKQGHNTLVHAMLESPQFKFTRDNPGALGQCVIHALLNSPNLVTHLLAAPRDPEVSLADYKGERPLRFLHERSSSLYNSRHLANLFVQHGDDPNAKFRDENKTALEYAIYHQNWNIAWGILESPGFVFKIGLTDNAVTMAIQSTSKHIAEHLLKLRKAAVDRQSEESIHIINSYYSENKLVELHGEMQKLAHLVPMQIMMLAINNQYPDLTLYLINHYFVDRPMDPSPLLRPAIEKEVVELAKALLDRKVNPNQVYTLESGHKRSPLWLAGDLNNATIIDLLIKAGADINFTYVISGTAYSLLSHLIAEAKTDLALYLINREEFSFDQTTIIAVLFAFFHRQLDIQKALAKKFKKISNLINTASLVKDGMNLLFHAVDSKQVESIQLCLGMGASPTFTTVHMKESPLLHAVKTCSDFSMIPGLLIFTPQFIFDAQALEALHHAIDSNKPRIALQLLTRYGDSKQNLDLALWKASLMGFAPVVARLLKLGVNPNVTNVDDDRPSALWASLEKEDTETIDLLLGAGALMNISRHFNDSEGVMNISTELSYALREKKYDSAIKIIASPKFSFKQETLAPLVRALKDGQMTLFHSLLDKCDQTIYDLDKYTIDGEYALSIAVKGNHPSAVRSLLIRGSNPIAQNRFADPSALMLAIPYPEIFQLLISLGRFEFDEHCLDVILKCIEAKKPDLAIALLHAHKPNPKISLKSCFGAAVNNACWDLAETLCQFGAKVYYHSNKPVYHLYITKIDKSSSQSDLITQNKPRMIDDATLEKRGLLLL